MTDHAEELSGLTETEFTDKLKELIKKYGNAVDMTDSELDNVVNGLTDYQAEINNLAESTKGAAVAIQNAVGITIDQSEEFAKEDEASQYFGEEWLKKEQEKIKDEVIKSDHDNNWVGSETTPTSKAIWNRYLEAKGVSADEWVAEKNQVQGYDSDRRYAYHLRGDSET
jgi:hypothetical protein